MSSAENSIPNSLPGRVKLTQKSNVDSTYGSARETGTSTSTVDEHTPRNDVIKPIQGSDLLMFSCAQDKVLLRKCESLRSWLEVELFRIIERAGKSVDAFSTHLQYIGRTKSTASLTLLMFCDDGTQDIIEKFLQRPFVLETLTFTTPRGGPLKWHIVPQKPIELSTNIYVEIVNDRSRLSEQGLSCGDPLVFRSNSGGTHRISQQFLHGGHIHFHFDGGSTRSLGMSAGHGLRDLISSNLTNFTQEDTRDSFDKQGNPYSLGRVLQSEEFPGITKSEVERSFDWALYTVNRPRLNQIRHPLSGVEDEVRRTTVTEAADPSFTRGMSESVLVASSSGYSRRGYLMDTSARLWLKDDQRFVDVHVLELESGTLQKGDSGAWVVSETKGYLYGQVVAKNALGQEYVMPALATCENMKQCLGALNYTFSLDQESECDLNISGTLPYNKADIPSISSSSSLNCNRPHLNLPVKDTQSLENRSTGSDLKPSLLRSRKIWNNSCSSLQIVWDRTLLETLKDWSYHGSSLKFFFEVLGNSRPSLAFEVISALQDEEDSTVKCGQVWLYQEFAAQQSEEVIRQQVTVSDAPQLRDVLNSPPLHNVSQHKAQYMSTFRRLIYIENIDYEHFMAIIETIEEIYADALRDYITKYLISGFYLHVRNSNLTGPRIFRMQFHIRYPRLRRADGLVVSNRSRNGHDQAIASSDSSEFLFNQTGTRHTLTECRQSFLLVGIDNNHWKGFAFSDRNRSTLPVENNHGDRSGHSPQDEYDSDDNDDDDDDDDGDDDDNENDLIETDAEGQEPSIDKFALGDSETFSPLQPLSDPRHYFLWVIIGRLKVAVKEWSYLTSMAEISNRGQVDRAMSLAVSQRTDASSTTSSLFSLTRRWMLFVSRLEYQIHATTRMLAMFEHDESFLAPFLELGSEQALKELDYIRLEIRELEDFKYRLHRIYVMCEDTCRTYEMQIAIDDNILTRRNNAMSDQALELNLRSSELNKMTAQLASERLEAAKQISRISHFSTYFVLVTAPFMITLQYFASEHKLFAFERTPKTFVVSVILIMATLSSIALFMFMAHSFKDKFCLWILKWLGVSPRGHTTDSVSLEEGSASLHQTKTCHHEKETTLSLI